MSRTAGGVTNYTWDVAAGLPVVLQDGTNTYVYGLDLISATDSGGAQTYFLYDGLGSTTGLTDGAGNNPVSYSYDAFGAIRTQSASTNYWLFTGEQRDSGSNFYYLRARYYDPAIGRFLAQDPLPGGNLYAYVANNPVNWVDPTGLRASEGGVFGGVNRGNLKPCPGGIEHIIKDAVGAGAQDDVLCESGKVYIQFKYWDKKSGRWKPGALEEVGDLKDYQAKRSRRANYSIDVVTPDTIIAGTAIAAGGAIGTGYYYYMGSPGTGVIPLRLGPPTW